MARTRESLGFRTALCVEVHTAGTAFLVWPTVVDVAAASHGSKQEDFHRRGRGTLGIMTTMPSAHQDHAGERGRPAEAEVRSLFGRPAAPGSSAALPLESRTIVKRTAVLIGVNSYVDKSIAKLSGCVNDVLALQELLKQLQYDVHVLHSDAPFNDCAILSNVLALLRAVCSELTPDELLFVHLSCHGVLFEDKGCYLLMQDTHRDQIAKEGLALTELRSLIKSCRARQRVLTLDACHSGIDSGRSASRDDAAEAAFRRRVHEMAEGFAVLSSSTAGQVSHDLKELGLFTSCLLSGLRGKAAEPGRPYVTVDDLNRYVHTEVARWHRDNPLFPRQQPNAQIESIGEMILAPFLLVPQEQPGAAAESGAALAAGSASQEIRSLPSGIASALSTYKPAAELAVACGCDRGLQWDSWQRLVQSRENWLFLLPGPKGEGHDFFIRRMMAECRKAFSASPPVRAVVVSWRRRQFPPATSLDYRRALAKALNVASPDRASLVQALQQQRERNQILLIHPVLDRGHCDPALLSYYRELLPTLLEESQSERTTGVKLVQPLSWRQSGAFFRLVLPVLTAIWPRPPESLRQALGQQQSAQLIKVLKQSRLGGLRLDVLPPLQRITREDLVQFLDSQDIPPEYHQDIISDLEPLNRESVSIFRDLAMKLTEYKEAPNGQS